MARHKYKRDEPTRRAVGPASRRIQPGTSLIGTRAVAATQTSRPAGQERVGMQPHAGSTASNVQPNKPWEEMGMWERAADWTKRTAEFGQYLGRTIVAGAKRRK